MKDRAAWRLLKRKLLRSLLPTAAILLAALLIKA